MPFTGMIDWIKSGFVYFKYPCMKAIMPIPMSWPLNWLRNCERSYAWTVVVTSLGSSEEPIGAGSTYFNVVISVISVRDALQMRVYICAVYSAPFKLAFLLVYLHLYVKVDTCDDQ